MMQVADTGVFENLKEKLTNPIIFTYFWVFCTWNHREILVLFFEPKLFSDKMGFMYASGTYGWPVLIGFFALFILPWANNVVEYWKQKAQQSLEETLHNRGWKPMVDQKVYQAKVNELNETQERLNKSRDIEIELRKELQSLTVEEKASELPILNNDGKRVELKVAAETSVDSSVIKAIGYEGLLALREGSQDKDGLILGRNTDEGYSLQTNNHNLITTTEAVKIAKWKSVLDEMTYKDLLKREGELSYKLTYKGFDLAKNITF